MSEHAEHNHEGLDRLGRLPSLTDTELVTACGDGWTVSTVLGHMAFFDRMLLLRWDTYEVGWSDEQIAEAAYEAALFNLFVRLADTFGIEPPAIYEPDGIPRATKPSP